MKFNVMLLLLVIGFTSYGQKMFPEQESVCPLEFILEDKEMFIQYDEGDSVMVEHLFKGIEKKHLEKIKGVVMLQVMVDTAHQACLVSYGKETNLSGRHIDVQAQFNKMEGWKRYAVDLENENICGLVMIYIEKYQVTVQRIGYNRNRGKTLLSKTVFNRYKKEEEANSN